MTLSPSSDPIGIWYQWSNGSDGVGPYFQYCVPTGTADGRLMVMVADEPAARQQLVKEKSPWPKTRSGPPAGKPTAARLSIPPAPVDSTAVPVPVNVLTEAPPPGMA